MPSTATITGWNIFTAGPLIKSSEVMANFAQWRGHVLPFDPTLSAAADQSYDLGSSDHRWRYVYGKPVLNIVSTTGSSTVNVLNDLTLYNATAGTLTATLPAVSGNEGKPIHIKNIGTGGFTVLIDGNASELIDGTLTLNIVDRESVKLVGYTGGWYQI